MNKETIHNSLQNIEQSNMPDYKQLASGFSWDHARAFLQGMPDGKLNFAFEALDRHVKGDEANQTALRWISKKISGVILRISN